MSDGVREYRIRGALGRRAFFGVALAEITTETPRRPRWIEMALYQDWTQRDTAGSPVSPPCPAASYAGYVLHVTGRSLVYHVRESDCNTGIPVRASSLDSDAEPCPVCQPPDLGELEDSDMVDAEEDRYTVHSCATPDELVERLHDPKSPAGGGLDWLSAPAQRLLQLAAARDVQIAGTIEAVQWL